MAYTPRGYRCFVWGCNPPEPAYVAAAGTLEKVYEALVIPRCSVGIGDHKLNGNQTTGSR